MTKQFYVSPVRCAHPHPQNKLLKRAHIVSERMFREIISFQKPTVMKLPAASGRGIKVEYKSI